MPTLVAGAAFVVALGILGVLGAATRAIWRWQGPGDKPASRPELETVFMRLAELELRVEGLPSLWEQERERAEERAETAAKRLRAARSAERSAARRAQGEGGEEDEWDADLGDDAGGSGGQGMLPLPESMAGDPQSNGTGEDESLIERALATGWSPFLS